MTTRLSRQKTALLSLVVGLGLAFGAAAVPAGASVPHERAADAAPRVATLKVKPYAATLTISKAESTVGRAVTLRGKVKPAAKGTVVKLQKKLEGKSWVNEKTLKTTAAGRFTYTDKPATPGKREYRVIVPATAKYAKDTSAPVSLTLYRWIDLSKVKIRSSQATYAATTVTINGVDYSRGLLGSTGVSAGMIDWNLDRRCTSLKARFGNGDESDATAKATVAIDVDGRAAYSATFALTQSKVQAIKVTGAFRIGFRWTSSSSAGSDTPAGAQAVMATPMVRCSF